ncbi:ATP-binding cassette domain-containing protein [Paracoccaceae bacterium]|nr:ATP-binding cassette domain-containing protein [Paracoccaceae bacterium]
MFPLRVTDVKINIKSKRLIGPINLEIEQNGISILLGANGSGKTTLLEALHGLRKLSAGKVEWNISNNQAAAEQAFVFQSPIMLRRTVAENLAFPLKVRRLSKLTTTTEVMTWAKKIGLEDKIRQQAVLLSGGEMQAIAVARALITKPKMLFLDEPTASLDGATKKAIEDILISASSNGTKILMSTHDLGQLKRLAKDIIFLHNGIVEAHCSKEEFLTKPPSKAAKQFLAGDIVL